MISSIRITRRGAHDVVGIWWAGALAGELTLQGGDGERLRALLLADPPYCVVGDMPDVPGNPPGWTHYYAERPR